MLFILDGAEFVQELLETIKIASARMERKRKWLADLSLQKIVNFIPANVFADLF